MGPISRSGGPSDHSPAPGTPRPPRARSTPLRAITAGGADHDDDQDDNHPPGGASSTGRAPCTAADSTMTPDRRTTPDNTPVLDTPGSAASPQVAASDDGAEAAEDTDRRSQ